MHGQGASLFLKMFKERIKNIYLYRHTLWKMAISQLKIKYSNSILGISWAVINPLLIMSAITFVFTAVFKVAIKNFSLFALSGILPWMFFSNALTEATASIVSQQSILRQFNLPKEIIPLSSILSNFINFILGWLIIYPLFIFFNYKIILLLPLLIIVLLLNLLFSFGWGLAFAVLNVLYRDVSHLLGILLMFWFWITPIFYSLDMVPARFSWICNFNPLAPFIVYYREVIFYNNVPSFLIFIEIFFWTVFSLIFGWLFFSHFESKILKQI